MTTKPLLALSDPFNYTNGLVTADWSQICQLFSFNLPWLSPPVTQVEEAYLFPNSPPGANHAQNKIPLQPLNDFISSLGVEGAAAIRLM